MGGVSCQASPPLSPCCSTLDTENTLGDRASLGAGVKFKPLQHNRNPKPVSFLYSFKQLQSNWKAYSALSWTSSFVTNKLFDFLSVCVWHHHFQDTNKILIWFHPDFAECCQEQETGSLQKLAGWSFSAIDSWILMSLLLYLLLADHHGYLIWQKTILEPVVGTFLILYLSWLIANDPCIFQWYHTELQIFNQNVMCREMMVAVIKIKWNKKLFSKLMSVIDILFLKNLRVLGFVLVRFGFFVLFYF